VISVVQPVPQKYSASQAGRLSSIRRSVPPTEGRIASRHGRGRGCGGRGSVGAQVSSQGGFRERATARRTNGAIRVRQNRVVLAPVAGVKSAVARSAQPGLIVIQSAGDGDKTNSSPGRARHKPSNHCAGNAGLPPLNLYARVRFFAQFCTRDRGCSAHPAFPAPFVWEKVEMFGQTSGKPCREMAESYLLVETRIAATHSLSSWRKPGPIIPNVPCCACRGRISIYNSHRWLWAPAFAGATRRRAQRPVRQPPSSEGGLRRSGGFAGAFPRRLAEA
jgi:hypothetical protein